MMVTKKMSKITSLVKNLRDYDESKFVKRLCAEALIGAGHHAGTEGWFDEFGKFLGGTSREACDKNNVKYRMLVPVDYYLVPQESVKNLIDSGEIVNRIHGVFVAPTFEGE